MRESLVVLVVTVFLATSSLGDVEYVNNTGLPVNAQHTIQLEELWRIDGESGDSVIGRVARIVNGDDGRSFLLDQQSGDVLVIGIDGQIEDRIGRFGDGPGEFRRPVDLFLTQEGSVGVVEAMPGNFELLSIDGEPQDSIPLPEIWDGGTDLLRESRYGAGRLFLRTAFVDRSNPNYTVVLDGLVGVDQETDSIIWFRDRSLRRAATNNHHREYERTYSISPWTWDVDNEGRVYVSEAFDEYEIYVYSAKGELTRIIDRKYETRTRDRAYRENLQKAFDVSWAGRTYRGIPISFELCEVDMDVQEIFARHDGSLWVLSSRGAYDVDQGVIAIFDVFNSEGRFDRQVAVMGEGCYFTDYFFLSGNMFYVVRNATEDFRELENGEAIGTDLFEVICYRLPLGE